MIDTGKIVNATELKLMLNSLYGKRVQVDGECTPILHDKLDYCGEIFSYEDTNSTFIKQ